MDHHSIIIIITASAISIKWCYLFILPVTGSSIEPSIFHVGCRHSLHVGLHCLQHIYLTMELTMSERPAQHLHLTMGGTHPRTMLERHDQHSHLTMGGTHPKPMSERPNTHIRPHLVRKALHLHSTSSWQKGSALTSYHVGTHLAITWEWICTDNVGTHHTITSEYHCTYI